MWKKTHLCTVCWSVIEYSSRRGEFSAAEDSFSRWRGRSEVRTDRTTSLVAEQVNYLGRDALPQVGALAAATRVMIQPYSTTWVVWLERSGTTDHTACRVIYSRAAPPGNVVYRRAVPSPLTCCRHALTPEVDFCACAPRRTSIPSSSDSVDTSALPRGIGRTRPAEVEEKFCRAMVHLVRTMNDRLTSRTNVAAAGVGE